MKKYLGTFAVLFLAALTLSAKAAMVINPYVSLTAPTETQVRLGLIPQNIILPLGTTQVYVSFAASLDTNQPFTIDTGAFTIARSGAGTVGPISFSAALYPGTSPTYAGFDGSGNQLPLNGTPIAGSTVNKFTFTAAVIPIPTVDQPGETIVFTPTVTYHQGNGPVLSGSNFATGTVVPEPGTLGLAMMSGIGMMALRRRR